MAAESQQASELPQVVVVESQQVAVVAKLFVVVGFVLQQAAVEISHLEFPEASVGQKSVVDK